MTTPAAPYEIKCAEIWGGVSVKQDEVTTPGVRAAIHSTASGDAKGGDIYYFSVCAYDTLTRIAIADVRGHGHAVSELSQWLYQSLEARMNEKNGAAVLTDLNDIVRTKGFEALTTAVVATFDRGSRTLNFAYAGHPPLLLGRAGQPWQPLEAGATSGPVNLPLGVLAGAKYSQESVRVEPGDRLFCYTDGVAECPGEGESLYGDARMVAALNRTSGQPLPDIRQDIRRDMESFACSPTLDHDDVTFMLVEVLQPPPFWKRRIFAGSPRA